MKKTIIILVIVMVSSQLTFAQKSGTIWPMKGLVRRYFAQPIDASFAENGNVAIQTPNAILDSVAGYISRAKKTIDICQYEYQTFSGDQICPALNAAVAGGLRYVILMIIVKLMAVIIRVLRLLVQVFIKKQALQLQVELPIINS